MLKQEVKNEITNLNDKWSIAVKKDRFQIRKFYTLNCDYCVFYVDSILRTHYVVYSFSVLAYLEIN